ncbi:hypothetical protein PSQ19_07355 [Devosia algicola]|uniref:Uncharacterized protein n=1 Tax=Devosia algicola TaxID=3026418 RepID=A0ABY7YRF7_9HYPH|nr:hypothetical protein [Devosia algicola]WDR03844.1 hypothetical protein PSQ19_07355 [Devosia algicola]
MQISGNISNGMAWAGVVFVVGVVTFDLATGTLTPSADQFAEASVVASKPNPAVVKRTSNIAEVAPVKVAPQPAGMRPTVPVNAAIVEAAKPVSIDASEGTQLALSGDVDVVDKYLASGRSLPAYISGNAAPSTAANETITPVMAESEPEAAPLATSTPQQAAAADTITVGSISAPEKVAPIPMPLSMRPKSVAPLIVDEARRDESNHPVPVAEVGPQVLGPDDLSGWTSGPLSDFLARKRAGRVSDNYDADGFFLDQGPQRGGGARVVRRLYDGGF